MLSTAAFPVCALVFPAQEFFFSPDLLTERVLFLGRAGYWFYIGMLVYLTVSLLNLEITFSSAGAADRERMKLEFIGVSAILAVLVFYYSQGLLYRSINMDLAPARAGVFLLGGLLVAYSRLFVGNGVKVSVSRYIVYRSVTLTLIGSYLLVLGLTGEGMRYFDVSFSRDLEIFVGFAADMAILFVILSRPLRRRMKVFINKNFFAHKHDYRGQWMQFTKRLAACRSFAQVQDAILAFYIETFGLKGASLYLVDGGRRKYRPAVSQGMEACDAELPADTPLITYFTERLRVFNPKDGEYAPNPEESEFVRRVRARLLVPLMGNGAVEGFLAFGEQLAPEEFVYEDYDLMKALARQSALSVINFRLSEEITETREVAAVGRISSFVVHDLKNMASSLAMTADNAGEYMQDPAFQADMVLTMKGAVARMNTLIQKLKPAGKVLKKELHDIDPIARDVVEAARQMKRGVEVGYRGSRAVSVVDSEEIRSVILNLVMNAFDALGEDGTVLVETGVAGDGVYVKVSDNGCGMSREFMESRLFKPFSTTKKKGFGIGLYQCRQIIEAHGGRCVAESREGEGSVFTVYLPGAGEPAHAGR